jgi:hypothetical protein
MEKSMGLPIIRITPEIVCRLTDDIKQKIGSLKWSTVCMTIEKHMAQAQLELIAMAEKQENKCTGDIERGQS